MNELYNNWHLVPSEFHYLRPWVEKYGHIGRTVYGDRPNFEETATREQLEDLRLAYNEVARREDSMAICKWCNSVTPGSPQNSVSCPMAGLLILFSRLAEAGIEPFVNREAGLIYKDLPPPNWSYLPADLHELEPLLKRYEHLWAWDDIYDFVHSASSEEIEELREVFAARDRYGERVMQWDAQFRDLPDETAGKREAGLAYTILFAIPDYSQHLFDKPARGTASDE